MWIGRRLALLCVLVVVCGVPSPAFAAQFYAGNYKWFDTLGEAITYRRALWAWGNPGHSDCIWTMLPTGILSDSASTTVLTHPYVMSNNCSGQSQVFEHVCKPGHRWVEDAANGIHMCVEVRCARAADCDDRNACTVDVCNASARCASTPRTCDDGLACTVDASCDPATGCKVTLNTAECTCTGASSSVNFHAKKEIDLAPVECPGLKGNAGVRLKLEGRGIQTEAGCGNDCTSTGKLEGSASAEIGMCSDTLTLTAQGGYSQSRSYVPECNPATCNNGCGSGYCRTDEANGSLKVAVSRAYGLEYEEALIAGKIVVRCGGGLEVRGTVSGEGGGTSNHGDTRGTCTGCEKGKLSVSGGAGAAVSCKFGLEFRDAAVDFGCEKCLSLDVDISGNVETQTGACGNRACSSVRADVKAAAELPKVKLGMLWWSAEAACSASLSACNESNSCGTCACGGDTCSEFKPKVSCSVCSGNSLLPFCHDI